MRNEAMNLPLQHITILEEAHHLLRRTSAAQSDEGSNILGKSVEMIANAIAEMRSFGEGFIIIDQSPGLLDMSVMRNTNTKIVLRLPESGDREMVGNTIGLKPEQMYEISRFGTGVAVIYQKDWREAVLCKVDRAAHEERLYTWAPDQAGGESQEALRRARGRALRRITPSSFRLEQPEDTEALQDALAVLFNSDGADRELAALLKKHMDDGTVRRCREISPYSTVVWRMVRGETLWKSTLTLLEERSVASWDREARNWIRRYVEADRGTENAALSLLLQHKGRNPDVRRFYPEWTAYICGREQRPDSL